MGDEVRKAQAFNVVVWECDLKDKAPTFVFYNPSTWPTWAKWTGGVSAVLATCLGGWFGYQHFYAKSKHEAQTSSFPTYAKVGAGVALAGAAGTFGAYQMGFIGDQEEGFGSAIRTLNPVRSAPSPKVKKVESSGMSWGMIGLVTFLFLIAVVIGGALVYFVAVPGDDSPHELEDIRVEE